jgi:hypothetical protein
MSLRVLTPGLNPIGTFDCLDADVTLFKGGEVCGLTSVTLAGTDKAAYDSFDGYEFPSSVEKRTVVRKTLASGNRPLFLADEGVTGYGTLLGVVVGTTAGQGVTGGALLGPHTASGSGKVTVWDKPGLYAVSLDACDTNASTGLQPTNTSLDAGSALYATTAGLLTPTSGSAFETYVVARFVSFETNGSLVSTPNKLVSALNSPSGSAAPTKSFQFAVFHFQLGV